MDMVPGLHILGQSRPDPRVPHYPFNHRAAMEVPIGGSMCANCEYLSDDQKHCTQEDFIAWEGVDPKTGQVCKPAGSDVIPKPIDQYCSDWYEMKDKKHE